MAKHNLFLIPGWAVNSNIWDSVQASLENDCALQLYDFPGYGSRHLSNGALTLDELVQDAFAHAPPDAVWLAWSLGAMVALQAAIVNSDRMSKLVLICPTAKFVSDGTWSNGQNAAAMDNLARRFENDYQTAIKRFLLLQAGTDNDARKMAKATLNAIMRYPQPNWSTLESGLSILKQSDLRAEVEQVSVPTCVIVGQEDRVIPAAAGIDLHQRINRSRLIELATGHAPFIEQPKLFVDAVRNWAAE